MAGAGAIAGARAARIPAAPARSFAAVLVKGALAVRGAAPAAGVRPDAGWRTGTDITAAATMADVQALVAPEGDGEANVAASAAAVSAVRRAARPEVGVSAAGRKLGIVVLCTC